jgi:peroxin-12
MCPLCAHPRRNDTVLAVSGCAYLCARLCTRLYFSYVFCYVCIARYVDEHARCPVTQAPCTRAHLLRLFVQT